jgi:2,4-dienoyl-CoA reductase-like NADH-dependent reductase (Old Yellow Enzyme family)
MTAALFTPYDLAGVTLANRIIIAPMCQYSATDGNMTDWHMMHLGHLAMSGAGLLFVEATAVEAEGRITAQCTGLYNNDNESAMKRVIDACRTWGNTKLGLQIGHAGRKASAQQPWKGGKSIAADASDGWQTSAPSPIAFDDSWQKPHELSLADIARIRAGFVQAAERAMRIGFDALEIHSAHGYLLHQFLSPLSNTRADAYGGSLANRMRFGLETFEAVRKVWPKGRPLGVRISATDWVDGGWTLEDSIAYGTELRMRGCEFIDVSSGGTDAKVRIPFGPSYQVPFAKALKEKVGMPTMAVGMITEAEQAEAIIANGEADMIAIARAFLDDPRWPWHAAVRLRAPKPAYPPQYARVGQGLWPFTSRYEAPDRKRAAE